MEVANANIHRPSRRERAVRETLLEELERIGGATLGWWDVTSLSYEERQRLVEETDPAFVDQEVAKMRRSQKKMLFAMGSAALLAAVLVGYSLLATPLFGSSAVSLLFGLVMLISPIRWYQLTKRRIFIYRALRALVTGSADAASPSYAGTLERAAADHAAA